MGAGWGLGGVGCVQHAIWHVENMTLALHPIHASKQAPHGVITIVLPFMQHEKFITRAGYEHTISICIGCNEMYDDGNAIRVCMTSCED